MGAVYRWPLLEDCALVNVSAQASADHYFDLLQTLTL